MDDSKRGRKGKERRREQGRVERNRRGRKECERWEEMDEGKNIEGSIALYPCRSFDEQHGYEAWVRG